MLTLGGKKKSTGRNINDTSNKKLLLAGFFVFFSLAAVSIFLINNYYQITLDKHRSYLHKVFDIKTEVIETLVDNSTKYSGDGNEQAFRNLLFSKKSMYGLGALINVAYISQRPNGLVYLFHQEKDSIYPSLEIKTVDELDALSRTVLENKSGEVDEVDFLGDKVFGYYSELENLNWSIVTKVNYKEVQEPFISDILIIFSIIIICFFLSFILFREINRTHVRKIKNTAERNNQLIATSGHVIYTLDYRNYEPTFVSDNVKAFLGYEVDEIVGNARFWREHVYPDDIFKVKSDMSTLYKEGEVIFEYRLRKKSGSYIWIQDTSRILKDENGKIKEIIGSWVDVTYLKSTEEKIKEQKEYFENILQNLSNPAFIIDPNHTVIFWNKACEDLTGLSADKVIGTNKHWRGFYRLKRPCLADAYIDQLKIDRLYVNTKKQGREEEVLYAENWSTTYGGQRVYLAVEVSPVFDKDGALVAVVESLRDLTEHRNLETELIDARDKALEAVNIKGQFLANMSHEIRTPMNGVLGMLDLIKQTPLSEQQKDLTNTAYYSAESLLNIINEILDFSKLDAGKLQIEIIKFNLQKMLENIKHLFELKAEENNIIFKVSFDENIPEYVFGDPTRIRQILINLLSNACKFTEKGFFSLSVYAHRQVGDEITIQFDVEDSGIGIPQSEQRNLFDEFNQVDASTTRKFGGTGLGLAITKRLLDLLNGRIEVRSECGLGSCFSVSMPFQVIDLVEEPKRTDNVYILPSKEKTTLEEFSHKNILLVEDNKVNQKVALGILKKLALVADVAVNGELAVAKVKEGNYHLILMDCQMPVMNGYDATGLIRQHEQEANRPRIPIIAMTANAMQGDKEKCIAAGMDDYLSKPVDKELFKEKLFSWLSINNEHNNEVYTMSNVNDSEQGQILDTSVLVELKSIMEDEFLDILQIYMEESISLMSDVHNGFGEQPELLLRSVHTLKSSSNNVGAKKLGSIAAAMEALVKAGDTEGAKSHLTELQEVFTETHGQVKKYIETVINDIAV